MNDLVPIKTEPCIVKWYRYEESWYAGEFGPRGKVVLQEHSVVRLTPKGAVLAHGRFVLNPPRNGEGKRFAWPTKEQALRSFVARKARQIEVCEVRLGRARLALDLATKMQKEMNECSNG